MLRTPSVLTVAIATVAGGCVGLKQPDTGDTADTGYVWPPEDIPELREFECDSWYCTKTLVVDMAELEDCYDWHHVHGWQGDPPLEVEENCVPGSTYCRIVVRGEDVEAWDSTDCPTHCAEGEQGDEPPSECCFDELFEADALDETLLDPWAADGAALLDQIQTDCGTEFLAIFDISCGEPITSGAGLTDPCSDDSVGETTDTDYVMNVAPSGSYLTLHTSSGEDTVALAGTGAASTGPAEFLIAIVDAQDSGQIGTDVFTDLRFWFTEDISLNLNSGSFTIPAAQGYEVKVRGKRNGDWFYGVFEPTANAAGELDDQTDTWYLDYTSTFPGGWVDLHLEGTFYATSTP